MIIDFRYLAELGQSMPFFGAMTGVLLFTYVSDNYGRKFSF